MTIPVDAINDLEAFIRKEKFGEESPASYPPLGYTGLSDKSLTEPLTALLNQSAADFIAVAKTGATERKFRDAIQTGLERFSENHPNLETEDRERICDYYEQIMDCVELENSGGHLNTWLYLVHN